MEHLSFGDVVGLVGIPLAVLAVIASIAVVGHKKVRILLTSGLIIWLVVAVAVLTRRLASTDDRPNSEQQRTSLPALRPAAVPRSYGVATPASGGTSLSPNLPDQPRTATRARTELLDTVASVTEATRNEAARLVGLDAIRARLIGRWRGVVPHTGSPPVLVTLNFREGGELTEEFLSTQDPHYVDLDQSFLEGFRDGRGSSRYDVSAADSLTIHTGHWGITTDEVVAFSFVEPNKLVLLNYGFGKGPGTVILVRL